VVPAWAAVAIALGGSFITALSSIVIGLVVAKRQAVGEWREVFLDAAQEFSTGVAQALRGAREAIRLNEEREPTDEQAHHGGPHQQAVQEAVRLVAVADDRLARVQLLFGHTTRAGKAASNAIENLRATTDGLRGYLDALVSIERVASRTALTDASSALQRAQTEYEQFNEAAAPALPGWPYGRFGVFRTGRRR
jgi:hypothetical protein